MMLIDFDDVHWFSTCEITRGYHCIIPYHPSNGTRPTRSPWLSQDPKDRTAEIATLLAQPAPSQLRILTWNIDGLDEVGGGRMKA